MELYVKTLVIDTNVHSTLKTITSLLFERHNINVQ